MGYIMKVYKKFYLFLKKINKLKFVLYFNIAVLMCTLAIVAFFYSFPYKKQLFYETASRFKAGFSRFDHKIQVYLDIVEDKSGDLYLVAIIESNKDKRNYLNEVLSVRSSHTLLREGKMEGIRLEIMREQLTKGIVDNEYKTLQPLNEVIRIKISKSPQIKLSLVVPRIQQDLVVHIEEKRIIRIENFKATDLVRVHY